MAKTLFLGDEAVAQAALAAGLSGVYAYPGTPSTEITEFIQNSKQGRAGEVHSIWAGNEKTAMESAIGMSYAGKRAMVCMKHVGLNVAADPFMNSSITGANGGLVVVVADDPSMHSSQDEQDSRYYAKFALIPCFEPSNQQEAYDITYAAFECSEKYNCKIKKFRNGSKNICCCAVPIWSGSPGDNDKDNLWFFQRLNLVDDL